MNAEELSAKLAKYRLSAGEHKQIIMLLGREPQGVDGKLFSALWREHCSYQRSRVL